MSILFEFPLNERIRLLLRIEHVFNRVSYYASKQDALSHHTALLALFEFLELSNSRSDIKSEVLQELERQRIAIQGFREHDGADPSILDAILKDIDTAYKSLQNNLTRVAQNIREDEWLMSIFARSNVAGGTCSFDLPSYHGWLHQPETSRQLALENWTKPILPLISAVNLVLKLLRESYAPREVIAVNGAYQQDMRNKTYQLVRVWIPIESQAIPEMSANKYGVWIRLLKRATQVKTPQIELNVPIQLAMCVL